MDRKRFSTLARLGLERADKKANKVSTYAWTGISLIMCLIIIALINNSVNKVMEQEVNATRMMEQKIIYEEKIVPKKIYVNDCDTVYIIDGKTLIKKR